MVEQIQSNANCGNGHFICDSCHETEGFDYVETYCKNSKSTNPVEMATAIMNNPKIKLHGPEHHFLVPAVLITSYYNKTIQPEKIEGKLKTARERAQHILGGFCGFYGNCGAGVGTGIFASVVLNSTPLSTNEWKMCNLITAESLFNIASYGGPRCCKRDTWLALESAVQFTEKNLSVKFNSQSIVCNHYSRNKQCLKKECKYFPIRA